MEITLPAQNTHSVFVGSPTHEQLLITKKYSGCFLSYLQMGTEQWKMCPSTRTSRAEVQEVLLRLVVSAQAVNTFASHSL